jgi:hypothetical protein
MLPNSSSSWTLCTKKALSTAPSGRRTSAWVGPPLTLQDDDGYIEMPYPLTTRFDDAESNKPRPVAYNGKSSPHVKLPNILLAQELPVPLIGGIWAV